jgi:hypothetical protein
MSKGPGRIQQAIKALFVAEPDNAFTTAELCERIYGVGGVEKKHRVAVMRAAKAELSCWSGENLGKQLVFYDPLNVRSYAMARLKSDFCSNYRNADQRTPEHWITSEADLRKQLGDEQHRKLVAKGGSWWLHTEIERARAAGDGKRAAQLQAKADKKVAESVSRIGRGLARRRARR